MSAKIDTLRDVGATPVLDDLELEDYDPYQDGKSQFPNGQA